MVGNMTFLMIFAVFDPSPEWLREPFCTSVPNFVKIGQTVADILRFM